MEYLGPNDPIPVGEWRLGIFVLNADVVKGHSEDWMVEYITYWASKAGLDVSKSTMRHLEVDLHIGDAPGVTFGGWVRNTVPGLTPVKVIEITKIPCLFSEETAPSTIEWYLSNLQGSLGAGVVRADPSNWATADSPLQGGLWYAARARWNEGAPSVQELERRLAGINCNLFAEGVGQVNPPFELVFYFKTPNTPIRMQDVIDATGASILVIDLNDGSESTKMDVIDKLTDLQHDQFEAIGDAIDSFADAAKKAAETTGKAFDLIGFLAKYGPMIAVAGVGVYGWYRFRKRGRSKK